MLARPLHPHPAHPPSESFSLEAVAQVGPGSLQLHFALLGPMRLLTIPPPAPPVRRDNLWQHSCFEAFVAIESGYLEFNFSPSGEWAAYRFSGHRSGRADLESAAPVIRVRADEHRLELAAIVTLPPDLVPQRLGLSAVIEDADRRKSYWALAHPPGNSPDFHHPDCFAIELPPASEA